MNSEVEDLYNCPYFLGKKSEGDVRNLLLSSSRNNGRYTGVALFLKFSNFTNGWLLRIAFYDEETGVDIYRCYPAMWMIYSLSKNPQIWTEENFIPMLRKSPFTLLELARAKVKANVSSPDFIEDLGLPKVEEDELKKLVIYSEHDIE